MSLLTSAIAEQNDRFLASSEELAAYRVELSMYDTATVEALMDNQEKLDEVRDRIDVMLTEAYVLADGRRVFRTKDGLHVLDEQGQELSKDIIDPDSIADHKPRRCGRIAAFSGNGIPELSVV